MSCPFPKTPSPRAPRHGPSPSPVPRAGGAVCDARLGCRRRAQRERGWHQSLMALWAGEEDRRKASKVPLVQTPLSLPSSTQREPQWRGQSGSSSALFPPRTPADSKRGHPGPVRVLVTNAPRTPPPSRRRETATLSHHPHHCCCLHLYMASHHPVRTVPTSLPRTNASPSSPTQPPLRAWHPPDPVPAAAAPQTQVERVGPLQQLPGPGHDVRGSRPASARPFALPHEQCPRHESPDSAAQTAEVYFLSNSSCPPRWTCCVCLQHASLPRPSRCAVPAAGGPSHLAGRCGAVSARISLGTKKPCVTSSGGEFYCSGTAGSTSEENRVTLFTSSIFSLSLLPQPRA